MTLEERSIYPLQQILAPMKPCRISDKNPRQILKLNEILSSPQYVAEEKIDGCHYMLIDERFFSTHISVSTSVPVEKTEQVLHLVEDIKKLNMPNLILDGEIYLPGQKSNDVTSIIGCLPSTARSIQQQNNRWLQYRVFDILRDPNGNWLVDKSWIERRKILEGLSPSIQKVTNLIQLNSIFIDQKEQYLQEVFANGGEGIVLKDIYGTYHTGKRPMWNWIKVKAELDDDVVIMGFEEPVDLYTGQDASIWPYWKDGVPVTKYHYYGWIGAIVFGKYKDGKLIKLGTCSGMTEDQRKMFSTNPEKYIGSVIVIKAMEKTKDGFYRHPRFIRLHSDKNAIECKV